MPGLFDIRSATGSYSVVAERNAFAANGRGMREGVVIADAYFAGQLSTQGIDAISLQADESTKSLDALGGIIVKMRDTGATRDSHLWAVGGGAIQDVAAFVASIYMRGIAWTYIPTTLLGMVDSCIGGKSSINVGSYKNIVGTFHTPSRVVVDSSLTETLSTEQRVAGLAEAAKICYCRGEDAFSRYLSLGARCGLNADGFESIALLSLEAKKWFVEIDEFDRAERLLLNLGHTFGHALEGASGFQVSHGVAVGVGILCSLSLSKELLGSYPGGPASQLENHIRGLLGVVPALRKVLADITVAETFERLKADKKHEIGNYRFVTFAADGRVQVTRLPKTEETRVTVVEALRTTLELLAR
jgi:3-dehydroquinate synthase